MKRLGLLLLLCAVLIPSSHSLDRVAAQPDRLYAMSARSIDGQPVSLSRYKGKVALVVNTASKCGFTPQYKGLQALYDQYKDRGFVVLGFPSNDFHSQEPGSSLQIKKFCQVNYGVTFPLFEKAHVKGPDTQPVFRFLKASPVGSQEGEIGWNFTKFLVDQDGRVVARFSTKVDPQAPQVTAKIEELLKPSAGVH